MTIGSDKDCEAFILGPCTDIESYATEDTPTFGEWSLREWGLNEFTNFNEGNE